MTFSPPAHPPVTPSPAGGGRALLYARRVGHFASVQMLVQMIGFATGILLVRQMEQREYALFTIANTMQGTINVLADIGISIGLVSIGGRVWQDGHRFGELISTGLKLRRKLGAFAIIGVTPLLYYMLAKNGVCGTPAIRSSGQIRRCNPVRLFCASKVPTSLLCVIG